MRKVLRIFRREYGATIRTKAFVIGLVIAPIMMGGSTLVFALKDEGMELSSHLAEAERKGQLHRLDVDVFRPNAWTEVHGIMSKTLGLPD